MPERLYSSSCPVDTFYLVFLEDDQHTSKATAVINAVIHFSLYLNKMLMIYQTHTTCSLNVQRDVLFLNL